MPVRPELVEGRVQRLMKTFAQLKKEFGKTSSGETMNKNIMTCTEEQAQKLGCFVAGTLVHTQEGLKPIEQIKLGDYVLSKPESGHGEPSYKRVSRTYEYDDKEVWLVQVVVLDSSFNWTNTLDHFIATGNHPVWVKGYRSMGQFHEVNRWIPVKDLGEAKYSLGGSVILELHDGRIASLYDHGGLLARTDMPNLGIVNTESLWDDCIGAGIDFDNNLNVYLFEAELNLDDQTYPDSLAPEGSVGGEGRGFPPLLRKVYNLEVEENHTYYVGEYGVLVHNTSASVLATNKGVAQKPSARFSTVGYAEQSEAHLSHDNCFLD